VVPDEARGGEAKPRRHPTVTFLLWTIALFPDVLVYVVLAVCALAGIKR
jgi:nitrate reductase NapE component